MINYINLNDVDKIARDLAKLDEIISNEYLEQDVIENDLDIHSDSEDEKADVLNDSNGITKGNNIINKNIDLSGKNNQNERYCVT